MGGIALPVLDPEIETSLVSIIIHYTMVKKASCCFFSPFSGFLENPEGVKEKEKDCDKYHGQEGDFLNVQTSNKGARKEGSL